MRHNVPMPPALAGHSLLIFLLQVAVLLLTALCLGRLSMRLGLPAVVGELLTGVLLGPSVFGAALPSAAGWLLPAQGDQAHLLDAVGQLGVLLLVGLTGAQLDGALLRRRRRAVASVAAGSLLLPLALGLAMGLVVPGELRGPAGGRFAFALLMGVAMCVSAIPVIAKTLSDMRLLHRDIGQLALATAVTDDAFGWLMLSVVSVLAAGGAHPAPILRGVLSLAGFVLVALVAGRPLTNRLFALTARGADTGQTAALAAILVLAGGAATQALGLEPVLGAFVAGILIGGSKKLQPIRLSGLRTVTLSVLTPVFLATAGLRVDLRLLARPAVLWVAIAVCLLAIGGKFAGAYLGARLGGLSGAEGVALGAGLNSRGIVEIVIAATGLRLGVLSQAAYTVIVLVAVVTSVMAPPLLRRAVRRIDVHDGEVRREAELASWQGIPAASPVA